MRKRNKTKIEVEQKPFQKESTLGKAWLEVFRSEPVQFETRHFEKALLNLILEPQINSSVLLRADILSNKRFDKEGNVEVCLENFTELSLDDCVSTNNDNANKEMLRTRDLNDSQPRDIPLAYKMRLCTQVVRRLIPRNPFKDYIINQTCLIFKNDLEESSLVVYIPHLKEKSECPYYLPPVDAIGIFYFKKTLSIHYLPFSPQDADQLTKMSTNDREVRIAFRLLQTSLKHSKGVMNGYEKRVNHDMVILKEVFQNRYIYLKKKYLNYLIENWQESTDPKKHAFEDIAIAAFVIEFWNKIYKENFNKEKFKFFDLGCGNGILVYILLMEGYIGEGIDARARKSWDLYPENVKKNLKKQVIIPKEILELDMSKSFKIPVLRNEEDKSVLSFRKDLHGLHNNGKTAKKTQNKQENSDMSKQEQPVRPKDDFDYITYTTEALLKANYVNTVDYDDRNEDGYKHFVIGNHSDEITLWIPLLGCDFLVIPCCSHGLSGERARFNSPKLQQKQSDSTYSGLISKVEEISKKAGWRNIEKEMLRIPSTKNCAIMGYGKKDDCDILQLLKAEGGAGTWVENTLCLLKEPPLNYEENLEREIKL